MSAKAACPVPDYTKRDFTALATAISPAGDHKCDILHTIRPSRYE